MACCSSCHSTRLQLLYHNSDIYFVYRCLDCNKVDDILVEVQKN